MHPEHLLEHIIRPTLEHLGQPSKEAEMLLLATAAVLDRDWETDL